MMEIASKDDVVNLLLLSVKSNDAQAAWIHHAVLCFIKSILFKSTDGTQGANQSVLDNVTFEAPLGLEIKVEASGSQDVSEGSSGDSSATMSGQEGDTTDEKLTDIASSIATNLMNVIKESNKGKASLAANESVSSQPLLHWSMKSSRYITHQVLEAFDKGFQTSTFQIRCEDCCQIEDLMQRGMRREKATNVVLESAAQSTGDEAVDFQNISMAFTELICSHHHLGSRDQILYHWLEICDDLSNNESKLSLPTEVLEQIMFSSNLDRGNKYSDFLIKQAMLTMMNSSKQANSFSPLLQIISSLQNRIPQVSNISHTLSLLGVLAVALSQSGTNSNGNDHQRDSTAESNGETRLIVKNLLLEVLKARR